MLGSGAEIDELSSGGFRLQKAAFTPARLAELAKMDGAIVLSRSCDTIVAANVHLVPDNSIPSDETGSRHRTAQRLTVQTGVPVVAVSEGRRLATLYIGTEKIELIGVTAATARVNQELQTLDRLRRHLDEADRHLSNLEVAGLATYRNVVTLLQRLELVRRVSVGVERMAVSLGDEGRLATIQTADLVRGVEFLRSLTLQDHLGSDQPVEEAVASLEMLDDTDLMDPVRIGKAAGFAELDEVSLPAGLRILSKAGRLPDHVREEVCRRFGSVERLIVATISDLEAVEGIGPARARHLRTFFDRLAATSGGFAPPGF